MKNAMEQLPVPENERPHFVLLGAGASLAALPNGDRWGRRLPLMTNLIDVIGLGPLLEQSGIAHKGLNFEVLYSELATSGQHSQVVLEIERRVCDYFKGMMLPEHATIYDHLVLSLRPKDFIATFNWDPFLEQAIQRNFINLNVSPPHIACLHGCVSLGYCDRHQPMTFGRSSVKCARCGNAMTPMRLFFPVTQKDYNSDPHTIAAWKDTQMTLKRSYLFTVFGYGAPSSDVEAVRLLQGGWGDSKERELEETELIDIRPEDELTKVWEPFIHSHHYMCCDEFYHSWIARHPRRSCEAFWSATMMCAPKPEQPIPRDLTLPQLWNWYRPLFQQEIEHAQREAR
jgi:hypothetical protein